jgi:hypothetical protein
MAPTKLKKDLEKGLSYLIESCKDALKVLNLTKNNTQSEVVTL